MTRGLAPLAWAFGALATCRRQVYRRGMLQQRRVSAPVISIGSLSMGGSGKTPVAGLVAERLVARGLTVAVVCGAYRGTERGAARVAAGDASSAVRFGDEAALLSRWLDPTPVVAGRNKLAAARLAVELGAQVIVVDDGFQHLRLARDLDLIVFDGDPAPAVVPLGPGREPASALQQADLLWLHLRGGSSVVRQMATTPAVVSRNRALALVNVGGHAVGPSCLAGARVVLMTGIAAPQSFRSIVESLGAVVVGEVNVRDHLPFRRRHFRRAAVTRPDLLLCTEKDLVRMAQDPRAARLTALVCRAEILAGASTLECALDRALAGGRR